MIEPLLKAVTVALVAALVSAAHAEEPPAAWPDTVVTIEQLHPLTKFSMKLPGLVVKGGVRGPSTLRVHVDATGAVVKATLLESCGNADLDEAAIHAMRAMMFSPYQVGGTPVEVSLVLPVHIPKHLGRSR